MKLSSVFRTWMYTMLMLSASVALAQVPNTMSYQGYLSDADGLALQDPVVVLFSIYTVESGGVPIWSEFQDVFPDQGLFSVNFGSDGANPFPLDMFQTPLFLGIKVGTDSEMVPRSPYRSNAFSQKSSDSNTVGGLSAAQLDQSSAVANLSSSLTTTQTDVSQLQSDVSLAQSDVLLIQSDVSMINTDLLDTSNDVVDIENTLPMLQRLVTGSCLGGSAIRQVFTNGSVTCEQDDAGPWVSTGTTTYLPNGERIGLGTTAAAAVIQIDSPIDVDPFRARVGASTKLRVHTNGSVSVGTSTAGPENGLYVNGGLGLGTSTPTAKMQVSDANWQTALANNAVGGDIWYTGSSADAWNIGGGKYVISGSTNSGSSAFVIDSGNKIGMGTTAPDTRVHINGGSDVNSSSGGFLTIGSTTSSHLAFDNNEIMGRNNGVSSVLALNAEGGEVTVNSGGDRDNDSLSVVGRVLFTNGENSGMRMSATNSSPTNALFEPTLFEEGLLGSVVRPFWRVYSREFFAQSALQYKSYSDRALKKNIVPIEDALSIVSSLEGVSYALTDHPMDPGEKERTAEDQFVNDNQLGFIAQDVAEVLPQLVSEDASSGLKTVAYMGVIPVLVEALKQQQQQIEQQRQQVEELKQRLDRLN